MREILFRGKRIDNGEWVEGDLLHSYFKKGDTCICCPDWTNIKRADPATVGQYTGLTDKRGRKIFEGDIVKTTATLNDHHHRGATFVSPVEYWNGATCLSITYVPLSLDFLVSHEIEIIGNIHDTGGTPCTE